MTALLDLLLTRDRHTRLRLSQSALAGLLMFGCVSGLHYAVHAGMAAGHGLWPWTAASLSGVVGVFVLIRSGWSRRLADPSMTLPQMFYAILCAAAAYPIAGSAYGIVPLVLTVVLMFGMFGLGRLQMLAVVLYALVLFGGVMWWCSRHDPVSYPPAAQRLLFGMVAMVLCAVLVLSARLSALRDKLLRQRTELERALLRIQDLATHDELTGLVNRRQMTELLEHERERSRRAPHPWCIALIDLDHFKQVNDRHGHAVGDEVLRAVARAAVAAGRRSDVLARWGGEEFVLLMPDTPLEAGMAGVERVRRALTGAALDVAGLGLQISFSAGVAQHRVGEAVEQTLARADAALYAAKAEGRNRVCAEECQRAV